METIMKIIEVKQDSVIIQDGNQVIEYMAKKGEFYKTRWIQFVRNQDEILKGVDVPKTKDKDGKEFSVVMTKNLVEKLRSYFHYENVLSVYNILGKWEKAKLIRRFGGFGRQPSITIW